MRFHTAGYNMRLNLGCKLLKFNRFAVVKSACVAPGLHPGLFMFNRFAVMDYE